MEMTDVKDYWREEDRCISQSVKVNPDVRFRRLRTSLEEMKTWRLVRITLWCVLLPVLILFVFLPNVQNDGSVLFYVAASVFVLMLLIATVSYLYTLSGLWKIDLAGPLVEVHRKIVRLEKIDRFSLIFRFIALPVALLCAYKIFGMGSLTLKPIYVLGIFVVVLAVIFKFGSAIKYRLPKEYSGIKPFPDEDQ